MESFGGMLTFGLLGNPIINFMGTIFGVIVEDITPTVTPTPTAEPPTPPIFHPGGGGGRYPDLADDQRLVKVTIVLRGKRHVSIHKVNDKTLRISINILKALTNIKEKTQNVFVGIRKAAYNIKVKINGDGN